MIVPGGSTSGGADLSSADVPRGTTKRHRYPDAMRRSLDDPLRNRVRTGSPSVASA